MSLGPKSMRGWKGGVPLGLAGGREEPGPGAAAISCREWEEGKEQAQGLLVAALSARSEAEGSGPRVP